MSVSETGVVPGDSSAPDDSPRADVTDIAEIAEISETGDPAERGAYPAPPRAGTARPAPSSPPTATWTGSRAGSCSTSASSSSPKTTRRRCLSGCGSSPSSPPTWTSSSWSGSPGLMRRMAAGLPVYIPSGYTPDELLKNTLAKSGELASQARRRLRRPHQARARPARHRDPPLEGADRGRARRARRAVQEPDLPGPHAAGGGPGAPVPVHLRAVAQPGGHPHRPGQRPDAVRPGQGPAVAAALPQRQPLPLRPDRGRDRRAPEPAVRRDGHHRALRLPGHQGPRARGGRGRHGEPAPGDGARAGQAALRAGRPARGRAGHVRRRAGAGWPGNWASTTTRSTKATRAARPDRP